MANTKVSALTEDATPTNDDLVYLVDDPAGTPTSKKATLANVIGQLGADIKTAYEAEADTNAFTDAEQTKLSGIETSADVTDETNVTAALPVSDATTLVKDPVDATKLVRIDAGSITTGNTRVITMADANVDLANLPSAAEKTVLGNTSGTNTGDMTDADVKTAYENNADTNAFTDAEQTKLSGIETSADVTDETNVTAAFPISDATTLVKDPVDATKLVRIDAGSITTGNTRVITMADANVDLANTPSAAEKTVLGNTSGTNSGDQTSIVGISGTKAEFDTAVSDGNITFDGDAPTAHAASHTDGSDDIQSATNAQKGLATAAHITAIEANTAKTTNATHTGQVTGSGALTLDVTAITDQGLVTAVGADTVIIVDATDGTLKKSLVSDFASAGGDMAAATYDPATIAEQLVGLTATQELTNKTLLDSTTAIADNVDNTKKITFQASGIATATTRTITMPNTDVDLGDIATNTTHRTSDGTDHTFIDQDVATTASPQFAGVNVGHATDTTITRTGAGDIAVEGNAIYRSGGTDVPVADGGTGRSSHTAYAVLCGGTTTTGAQQSIAGLGTSGQVLTSNGAAALPTFQAAAGGGDMLISTYDAAGVSEQLVGETATQTLTNKTINDVTNDVGADEVHVTARNQTGSTLTKGSAVYISGYNVGADLIEISLADSDAAATMPAIGLVKADITNTSSGHVIVSGELAGFDTSAFSVGDALFISGTAGALTATKPTAATAEVQKVAICTRSHATLGIVQVFGAGRTNDFPNKQTTDRFKIADSGDDTKLVAVDASAITTATTRTITMPDANVTLADIAANTTHRTSDGSDHTFISQDVTTTGNPQFATIELGAASDTTLSRTGAGDIAVEGNAIYRAGGTDVPVQDGGTGSSTAAGAATNLGLGTGDSPQFTGIELGHASDTTFTRVSAGVAAIEGNNIITTDTNKPTESFIIACSDETTDLTTGTAKVTFRMPYAFTLTDVRASLSTAATGATLVTVDVNESGTTILSTKLTFDASEKTTTTATTARVISDSSLADDAEMTIDIDAVGNTTAGKGLKVTLIGTRT